MHNSIRTGVSLLLLAALLGVAGCVPKPVPAEPDPWLERGLAHAAAGKHGQAVAAFSRALETQPDNIPALEARAQSHLLRGDYPRAATDYTRLLELHPEKVRYAGRRGLARSLMDDHAGAEADFTTLLLRQPENTDAMLGRGMARYHLGSYRKAIHDFTAVIQSEPEMPDALYYRARCHFLLGEPPSALADYKRILALMPGRTRAGAQQVPGVDANLLEAVLSSAPTSDETLKYLPSLDCLARHVLEKDTAACASIKR